MNAFTKLHYVFNIEEDAYAILQRYIEQLKRIFANEEGGNENMKMGKEEENSK